MLGFLILPPIGALIGWITNVIAIRYLFRPRTPRRILGITVQGVIPRYRGELAQAAARVVADRLFTTNDVVAALDLGAVEHKLVFAAAGAAQVSGERLIPAIIPAPVRRMIGRLIRTVVEREGHTLIRESVDSLWESLRSELDISETIRQRVLDIPLDELEDLVYSVAGRELRVVELLGALIGTIVGVLQALLMWGLGLST